MRLLCSKGANLGGARLEAWTSALEAELYKDGRVLSRRLDLIIGPDARAGKGASQASQVRVTDWER